MDLKYKPIFGGVMLLIGLANLVLSGMTGRSLGVVSGIILTLLGVLMLTKPVVSISRSGIGMHNLLGMELKRHSLRDGNYKVEKNKIYVDGKRRVSLWMLDTDEATVKAFLARD